jgi:hypothetical protein
MNKYLATLTNDQGCVFDTLASNSYREIKTWARGRGGTYTLTIETAYQTIVDQYTCEHDRLKQIRGLFN